MRQFTEFLGRTEHGDSLLASLFDRGPLVVLSGAGLSTSCGIPDYRDREGRWKRPQPIDHQAFLRSPEMRRRYWRRSFHGWAVVGQAAPGAGHRALTQLEQSGRIGLIAVSYTHLTLPTNREV